jgi:hypothetical protein
MRSAICLSNADGRCERDVDRRTCLDTGDCAGICAGGRCAC